MATASEVHGAAPSHPEACKEGHLRPPAFRVNKRIFGMLRDIPPHLILKLGREDRPNMLETHPGVVSPERHDSHHGWTRVDYGVAAPARIEILLRLAWTHVVPRRLVTR